MKQLSINTSAFFALLRAGLWEQSVLLSDYGPIDYEEVMRIAEEQSVVGIVVAGLEHIEDIKAPKEIVLQFVGQTLQLEQRNSAMNAFIERLIERMRKADIYALLVKGQGIAQCYNRPLWRESGDVDLLLSKDNYRKAKDFLMPFASSVEDENVKSLHLGMTIEQWMVELHGTLNSCSMPKMDRIINDVQRDVFYGGNVRSWMNGSTTVFLPSPDNDVIIIFTHILKHFFHEGIGMRQICDFCRLLWTYRNTIDKQLLEKRIKQAGILTEWMAFAAFAVNYLGMPEEAMPLYSAKKKWAKKAERIKECVIMMGNFGQNMCDGERPDSASLFFRKCHSLVRYTRDGLRLFRIFPLDSIKVWLWVIRIGVSTI